MPPEDTISSHSQGTALLSGAMAAQEGADVLWTMFIGQCHDLTMALIDDVKPGEAGFDTKKQREAKAIPIIARKLPSALGGLYIKAMNELSEGATMPAKIVQVADKVETNAAAEMLEVRSGQKVLGEFLDFSANKMTTETSREVHTRMSARHRQRFPD